MPEIAHYRLVACSAFTRELCALIARAPAAVDPEFLSIASHRDPASLRGLLQDAVDRAEGKGYDAVLLGYGLCGNAAVGLRARSLPLVVPRAHDCCTLLMGSSKAFLAEFGGDLSAPWSSVSYRERSADYMGQLVPGASGDFDPADPECAKLVDQYGEDNARYVWDTLKPAAGHLRRWIETPYGEALGRSADARLQAEAEGAEFRLVRGDAGLLSRLLSGPWSDAEFLTVPPGAEVRALYDFDRVMEAGPAGAPLA